LIKPLKLNWASRPRFSMSAPNKGPMSRLFQPMAGCCTVRAVGHPVTHPNHCSTGPFAAACMQLMSYCNLPVLASASRLQNNARSLGNACIQQTSADQLIQGS
jgi:hypothetical protein